MCVHVCPQDSQGGAWGEQHEYPSPEDGLGLRWELCFLSLRRLRDPFSSMFMLVEALGSPRAEY